jgi:hypothetical protein
LVAASLASILQAVVGAVEQGLLERAGAEILRQVIGSPKRSGEAAPPIMDADGAGRRVGGEGTLVDA